MKYLVLLAALSAGCHEHSDIREAIHRQQARIIALEQANETAREEKERMEYRATCLLVDGKFQITTLGNTKLCIINGSWYDYTEVRAILHYNNKRIKDASNAD